MALKVLDFRTREKICTNRYHNVVMANAYFVILIEEDGKFRELAVQVPKKYHYERELNYGEFAALKVNEYNVLVDFIKTNRLLIQDKWHLSEEKIEELLLNLKLCLINGYSTCSPARQFLLRLSVLWNLCVRKLIVKERI